jgi:hypothetical protein
VAGADLDGGVSAEGDAHQSAVRLAVSSGV